MRNETALILGREDMFMAFRERDIRLITFEDFKISNEPLQTVTIILFIDDNGDTKILKNRFGDRGNWASIKVIEDMKKYNSQFKLGYNDEYFDVIMSTYLK